MIFNFKTRCLLFALKKRQQQQKHLFNAEVPFRGNKKEM